MKSKINNSSIFYIIFMGVVVFQPFLQIMNKKFSIILILVPLIFLTLFFKSQIKIKYKNISNKIFMFFLLWDAITLIYTMDKINGMMWVYAWIVFYLIFLIFAFNKANLDIEKIIFISVIFSMIVSSLGLIQYLLIQVFGGWEYFLKYIINNNAGYMIYGKSVCEALLKDPGNWFNYTTGVKNFRATSLFGGPDANGMFASYFIIMIIVLRVKKVFMTKNSVLDAALAVNIINLILSFGRASWINCFVGLLVFIIIYLRQNKVEVRKNIMIRGSIIIGIIMALFIFSNLASKDMNIFIKIQKVFLNMFNFKEQSNSGRLDIFSDNITLFMKNPLSGVGIGSYNDAYIKYISKTPAAIQYTAHNAFMLFMVETGIIGLISFICLFASILLKSFKNLKSNKRTLCVLANIVFSTTLGILAQFMFDYDFNNMRFLPLVFMFWGLLIYEEGKETNYEKIDF